MSLLSIVPLPYRILGELAIVGAGLGAMFVIGHRGGYAEGHAEAVAVQARWDHATAVSAAAAASASEAARATEQRRAAADQEIIHDAHTQTITVAAAAGRALDSLARLRQRAASVDAAAGRPVPGHPAATAGSSAAAGPGLVLSDMLGRMGGAGGQLASYSDDSRIAGEACIRAYNSLRHP